MRRTRKLEKMVEINKKLYSVQYLINWYWGNLEYNYESCGMAYFNKLNDFGKLLAASGVTELTHKEFVVLVKERLPFNGVRKVNDCVICKKFGAKQFK